MDMSTPAILLLVFRRADLVHHQIEGLRPLRPPRLYVAADGPRPHHFHDHVDCAAVREVLREIDWPCEVKTLFRRTNLGVKLAVSQGIDWFFDHETEGIILEEDCFPHPHFLGFCAELLETYRDNPRIMQISGTNFQPKARTQGASYFFSRYNHVWGWATWRRAWKHYRPDLEGLDSFWEEAHQEFWANRREEKYWRKMFTRAQTNQVQSWAYRWTYSIWAEGGLVVYPEKNLVSNQGFDARATNTAKADKRKANRPVEALGPLVHPATVARCETADRWTFEHLFWGDPWSRTVHRAEKAMALAHQVASATTAAFVSWVSPRLRTPSGPRGGVFRFRRTLGSPSIPVGPATAYTRPQR